MGGDTSGRTGLDITHWHPCPHAWRGAQCGGEACPWACAVKGVHPEVLTCGGAEVLTCGHPDHPSIAPSAQPPQHRTLGALEALRHNLIKN